ncbi:MAG: Ig-like domain-containing protein [Pararobbsia sp.]
MITDANGSARFGVTDTQAETVQVSATLAANLSVTTAAPMRFASFVAQPLIGLTVTSGAAANGAAYNNVTVLLTEAGFALGGEAVRVTVDGEAQLSVPASGGGGGQSLTVVTNAVGLATLEVRDATAETVTVSAELIRMPEVAASSQMTFIVAHARLSLNLGSGAVADGEASNVGTIVLSDAAGEPWPQQTVLVTSEGSSTVTWAPAVTREASRRDAGRREAGHRDAGRRDAGRQEGDRREPGRRVDSRRVDGWRVDGWGEAARVEGVHPARAGANDRGLAAVVTDGSGRARIELRDTVPETVVVTAVLADEASVIDTQTTSFVAQARDVTVTELIVEPERIPADGVSAALLTATVMQTGSELPAEHALVNWSVVAGDGTLDVLHALSDANGHARTTFTSETPGEALVRATANQTSQSRAVQVTVKQQLTLELASGAAAGGVQGNAGVITLTDLAGRPWADEAVLVTPTGSAIAVWQNRSSRAYISVWTDSEGRAQIEVTDTVAETVTVTAEVKSDPSIADAKTAIFVGDIGDAGVVELSVAPSRIPADGATPATFIATVEDTGTGQVVPKVRVDWTIESGEGVLGATSSTSNASGQAITTLTSETEGTVVVAASANGTRRSQSIDVRGVELSMALGTGAVADGVASNAGTITLTGLSGDAWQGQSVIVTVDGGASLGLAEDWAGGGAREARGSGARRRPSKARTGTAARMRVGAADTASSRTGAAQPGAAKAGTGTADVVPGQEGRRQPPRVVTLAANALIAPTDAEGQVHIDITDAVAETVTVTATLSSDPDVTTLGTTAFVEVSEAGAVTALEVTPGSIPADGTTYATLTATVTNGGQAVPQVSVAWSILSGSGQLSTTSSTSNVLGRATVTLTSTAPGTVTVEAERERDEPDAFGRGDVEEAAIERGKRCGGRRGFGQRGDTRAAGCQRCAVAGPGGAGGCIGGRDDHRAGRHLGHGDRRHGQRGQGELRGQGYRGGDGGGRGGAGG